jgi:SHS2 domain-containing protein
MNAKSSGFREIAHTADWELEVWAPNLSALLEQAARGMYTLSRVHLQDGPRQTYTLDLQASDAESLLVSFLSELLYLGEHEALAVDQYNLTLDGCSLHAELSTAPLESIEKEIKAVTFHNLNIQSGQRGLEVRIVFDV